MGKMIGSPVYGVSGCGWLHALSTLSGWANSRCELSGPYVRVGIKSNTLKTSSDTIEHVHRALKCTGLCAGRTPHPPHPGPESGKSRSGSHRNVQIHEKKRPAPPPARPTTWGPAPQREIKSLGPATHGGGLEVLVIQHQQLRALDGVQSHLACMHLHMAHASGLLCGASTLPLECSGDSICNLHDAEQHLI